MIYQKIHNNHSYILNKKTSKIIIIWLIFLSISFILFLIIALKYEYNIYNSYFGYIKKIDNSFYTIIYVPNDKVSELSTSILLVDDLEYDFEIVSISDEYFVNNDELCYEVILNFNLKEKYLIENNIINLVLKNNKTTIYQELKKGLKKWQG